MKITMQRERADRAGELAQRLAHQARLKADMAVAHLALDLRPRHQRRDRIDHQHVDRIRAHQRIDDFQRLLAGVGLRHDQFVDIDAQLPGIDRIERMFGIDEGRRPAYFLRLCDGMERQRGLARAFRPVYLDDAPARQSADAQRDVQPQRPGGDRLDLHLVPAAQLHREPLPNARSICASAASNAFCLSILPFLSESMGLSCAVMGLSPAKCNMHCLRKTMYPFCSPRTRGEHNFCFRPRG
jgi:hypothetical protein